MLLVVQLTDTHLFADDDSTMFGCRTNHTFAAVMQAVAKLQPRPDRLLLTGDISQDETPTAYAYARSLIDPLAIPTYWLPGNHDQNLAAIAQLNGGSVRPDKSVLCRGWHLILLDSCIPNQPAGQLSKTQLQWFEQQLQDPSPTLVALHHHPIACGVTEMDQIGLTNADDLFAIVDRYPQVKLVIYGHIHQECSIQRGTIAYFGTPSTCIQLTPQQDRITLDPKPPGFRLLRLYPDGQFSTEVHRISHT